MKYSPAYFSMIAGDDGIVIIDTVISPADARAVLAEFRKITTVPVAGVKIIKTRGARQRGYLSNTSSSPDNFHRPRPNLYAMQGAPDCSG